MWPFRRSKPPALPLTPERTHEVLRLAMKALCCRGTLNEQVLRRHTVLEEQLPALTAELMKEFFLHNPYQYRRGQVAKIHDLAEHYAEALLNGRFP